MKYCVYKIYIVVLSIFVISGCAVIGVGVVGDQESRLKYPNISKFKSYIWLNPCEGNPITKDELIKYWGKPDEIYSNNDNIIKYKYYEGHRWRGIYLGVVIPIPIIIPIGHAYNEFEIINNKVVSIYNISMGDAGFYCGFNMGHPAGCGFSNTLGDRGKDGFWIEGFEESLLRHKR